MAIDIKINNYQQTIGKKTQKEETTVAKYTANFRRTLESVLQWMSGQRRSSVLNNGNPGQENNSNDNRWSHKTAPGTSKTRRTALRVGINGGAMKKDFDH